MIIKKGITFDETTELSTGKYFFHFKQYLVNNIDMTYELLRLAQNREITLFNYKIKTYQIETYKENDKIKHKIRIDISKTKSNQVQAIPVAIKIAAILIALGLGLFLVWKVLEKIEKILAEIPDIVIIVGAGLITYKALKK